MKSNNSGIRWHRIFGLASIIAVLIFAAMLYADFGTSIRPAAGTGKATEDTSASVGAANDMSGNDTDTKKQGASEKAVVQEKQQHLCHFTEMLLRRKAQAVVSARGYIHHRQRTLISWQRI